MKLKLKKKHLDNLGIALRPTSRLLSLEGTARSSKTVEAIQIAFYRIWNTKEIFTHCFAGYTLDSVRDNLLESGLGLLDLYPEFCKFMNPKIGSPYINFKGKHGTHKILLCGYADKTKWKVILGKSLGLVLIDEVNIASKEFVLETFARQMSSIEAFTIFTLNGDDPQHWVYQEFINHCRRIGKQEDVPASIRVEMEKFPKKDGYYYSHWSFKDNPAMTPDLIKAALSLYPIGSYYYQTKSLGERGVPGKLIYIDYLSEDLLVDSIRLHFVAYTIGMDIGATRAFNSITLIGWTKNYEQACVIAEDDFKQIGYAQKTSRLFAFLDRYKHLHNLIEGVFVDSAELNYRQDLDVQLRAKYPFGAPKWDKPSIKDRIDAVIVAMARKRLLFDQMGGRKAFNAFQVCPWAEGKEGKERQDNNEWFNDKIDSTEYGLRRHLKALMRGGK